MHMRDEKRDTALLRNEGRMIFFSFGGKDIRFLGPKCLRRFTDVKKWHDGYIEVMADYGARIEEDYIDLMPILENLYIPAHDYVRPIKRVELNYV